MRKIRELLTPENVFIEYELAGLGSRMIAFTIDTIIQLLVISIISIGVVLAGADGYTMNSFSSILIAIGIILYYIVFFGYYTFFEMLMNGQSPGKRIVKLKVIKQTGEPISFLESVLRNFLRLIDIYLSSFLLGSILLIFTKDCKRVGDFAANTIVVKVKKVERLVTVEELYERAYKNDVVEKGINTYPVNELEYSVLKEFIERKSGLGGKRDVFTFHLYKYFSKKFGITNQNIDKYSFLETVLKMNGNT